MNLKREKKKEVNKWLSHFLNIKYQIFLETKDISRLSIWGKFDSLGWRRLLINQNQKTVTFACGNSTEITKSEWSTLSRTMRWFSFENYVLISTSI